MTRLALLIAAASLGAGLSVPARAAETAYIVRHFHKQAGDDPSLTPEGAALATALANRLAGKGIKAVFATPTRRAQETAAPLAARLGIAVTPYDPRNLSALVKAAAAVKNAVLVVGHSNTVPDLVASFGGERPPALTEQDYGTLYVVEVGKPQVEQVQLTAAR